jgi:hypothetical protein
LAEKNHTHSARTAINGAGKKIPKDGAWCDFCTLIMK